MGVSLYMRLIEFEWRAQMECSNAEEVSEDGYGQFQDELLGRKREVVVAHNKLQTSKNEIQDKKVLRGDF